jgi:hypothetical protein
VSDHSERTWAERPAKRLVEKIRELAERGNRREVVISRPGGREVTSMTLTATVLLATAMTLIAPPVVIAMFLIAIFAGVRVTVRPTEDE